MSNKTLNDEWSDVFTKRELEMLREAFDIYVKEQCEKITKEAGDLDKITFSNNYKIKMNKLFREKLGIENVPYPEVNNKCEKN